MISVRHYRLYIAIGFIFLMIAGTACMVLEVNPVTGNRRALAYSWQQEIQIGRDADQQIVAEYGLYDNPQLDAYVNRVAKSVLQHSHLRREGAAQQFRDTEFHFRVLNSDIVNAFALPGGYIYVTRGLLSHLNNEAQLAVVLGHEIGHVAARHASQRILEQQAGSLILVGGAVLGQEVFGVSAENILSVGGMAAQLLFLSYSRDNERESDRLGVEYSAMEGYNAAEGAAFFTTLRRMTELAGGGLPSHLSSHPDPGDRERSMIQLSQQWREQGYEQTKVGEDAYLAAIDRLVIGQNPREGFVEDNMFYHPDMKFQYPVPSNWKTLNQASRVVVFEPDQKAISIFSFASGVNSAREAVEQFTGQEGITVVSSTQNTINGNPGYQSIATAKDRNGNDIRVMVQGIQYDGNVYRFLNYSLDSDFGTYQGSFNQIVNGFRQLTDNRILNIPPVRLQVTRASRTGTFQSFLPSPLPDGFTAEELAILNQLNLNDIITIGQKIKLPVQQ